jgi:SAM-dependent methyltransferase
VSPTTLNRGRAEAPPKEFRRLWLQGRIYEPLTRRFLVDAGIRPGMRVLDIGSGIGDLALLAGDIVGRDGAVVGVEIDPGRAAVAAERARASSRPNVTFATGDVETIDAGCDFDAVVGRFVLRELADPARQLVRIAEMAPRGVIAFQEKILTVPVRAFPPMPSLERVAAWMDETRRRAAIELEVGAKLPALFREAGLGRPNLCVEAPCGSGPEWLGFEYLAESLRGMLTLTVLYGVADLGEVQIDTVADRMRGESPPDGCVLLTPCVGAYARVGERVAAE